VLVGATSDRGPQLVIAEDLVQGRTEGRRRSGWDEHAAPMSKELGSVGVRCGDDRPAGAHGVRQRARDDLVEVGVRGDEDVGRLQPAGHLDPADEPVDEPHVVAHPQGGDSGDE
jgi:hypothetical protein